jgi:uncharacterized protein (TIRG00374 family)
VKKKHLGYGFGLLLALAAITWLVLRWQRSGFRWTEFAQAVEGIDWNWMIPAILLALTTYVGRAIRWEIMLRPLCGRTSFSGLLSSTIIGFTAVVLFGRAGEPVRPYLIAKRHNVVFSTQVAAWLVERMLDLLLVLLLFGLALSQVSRSSVQPGPHMRMILETGGYAAGVAAAVAVAILTALRLFQGRVHERLRDALGFLPELLRNKVVEFAVAFDHGMRATRDLRSTALLVLYTAAEWLIIAGSFWCILKAFPVTHEFRITDVIILLGFVVFGNVIQLPGIGGGMQLTTVLVLTEFFGVTVEAASGIALVLWLITFVSVVPIGLGLAFHDGLKWRSLRNIALQNQATSEGSHVDPNDLRRDAHS